MKKQLLFLLALIISATTFAQGGFTNYKAVITDGGTPLINHSVTVRFTVLHGATQVFQETQNTTTDANGIITLNIGEANPTPWFAIQWKQLGFSLKTEYDTGSGFVDMGTQAFRFMPYAQHARTADIANTADEVDFSNITNVPAGLSDGDDVNDADHSITNELQTLSLSTNQLTISDGNNVTFTGWDTNAADDVTNINDLSDAKTNSVSFFLGNSAGAANTGHYNSGVGIHALNNNTNGQNNVAFGYYSLENVRTGDSNVGVGMYALRDIRSGNNNTAIGDRAGYSNTGNNNIFIGNRAGYNENGSNKLYISNTDTATPLIGGDFTSSIVTINGSLNITSDLEVASSIVVTDDAEVGQLEVTNASTFHGAITIADGTQGANRILTSDAIGGATWQDISAWDNDASDDVTKLDDLSDVKSNTTSIYLGADSGTTCTGSWNTTLGYQTLSSGTGAHSTTAIGYQALFSAQGAAANTTVGYKTLYNNTIGSMNVVIGKEAGYSSTGNGNIFIGYKAGYNETGDNKLYIDNSNTTTPLIYGDFDSDELTINGSIAIKDGTQADGKVLVSDANGNASWSNTLPKQTKTINYAPNNFTVFSDNYEFRIGLTSAYIKSTSSYGRYLMLPINLPQSVKITNIKIYYKDDSTSNLKFDLKRKPINQDYYYTTTLGTSSEEDSDIHTIEYSAAVMYTNNYAYSIAIKNDGGSWGTSGDMEIFGVTITYEE